MVDHDHKVCVHFGENSISLVLRREPMCSPHERIKDCIKASNLLSPPGFPKRLLLSALLEADGWLLSRQRVRTPAWVIAYPIDAPYCEAPFYLKMIVDMTAPVRAQYDFDVRGRGIYITERAFNEMSYED